MACVLATISRKSFYIRQTRREPRKAPRVTHTPFSGSDCWDLDTNRPHINHIRTKLTHAKSKNGKREKIVKTDSQSREKMDQTSKVEVRRGDGLDYGLEDEKKITTKVHLGSFTVMRVIAVRYWVVKTGGATQKTVSGYG